MAIWIISCVKLKSVRPHSVITVATWLPIWKQEFQVKLDLEETFRGVNAGSICEKVPVLTFKNLTSLCICQYSEGRSATLCKIKTVDMKAEKVPCCIFLFVLDHAQNTIVIYFWLQEQTKGNRFWLSDSCIVYEHKNNIVPSRGPFDTTLAMPIPLY